MKAKLDFEADTSVLTVNVLIVFDSVLAGKQAKELCDRLGRRLGPEFEIHLCLWKSTILKNSAWSQAAVTEATSAALIIVAVNGEQPLAAPVRSCLQRCASRLHPHGGALVVQLYGILKMDEEVASAYSFLKQLANQTGAAFFSEVVKLAVSDPDYSIESIHQRAQMPAPVLDSRSMCIERN
jgi:hypothetical protein